MDTIQLQRPDTLADLLYSAFIADWLDSNATAEDDNDS
jgi:hypothetical protein